MSSSSREPVAKAGAVAGIVAGVLAAAGLIARAFGWVADDVDVIAVANRASDVVLGAAGLWATAAPVALAIRARAKVTPLADPRDAAGRVLAALTDPADELGADVRDLLTELVDHLRGRELVADVDEDQVDEDQVDELDELPPVPAPASSSTPTYDGLAAAAGGLPTAPMAAVVVADTTGRHEAPDVAGA